MAPKPGAVKLPPGVVNVRDVLEGNHRVGTLINVIGIVTDFRAPVPPRQAGKDWKCQIRLYDSSVEYDDEMSLAFHIFRRNEAEMPDVGCGDMILISQAKVQRFQMLEVSLCTNIATTIFVYRAKDIPKPPGDASPALVPQALRAKRQPTKAESAYISALYHSIDKVRLPDESDFIHMKIQSSDVKDKFRELKDVQDGVFCDIITEVVREPYDGGDKLTLWVSDYTENPWFYNHAAAEPQGPHTGDSDPYGYTANFSNKTSSRTDWGGPAGKHSLQITCFEPHATAIRESKVTSSSWLSLRNVQIKLNHSGSNLEGYLREDRGAAGIKINVFVLDPANCPDAQKARIKSALRRKKDIEKSRKTIIKGNLDAAQAGQKRRATLAAQIDPPRPNSKDRRKVKRARERQAAESSDMEERIPKNLNALVKCENQAKPPSTVGEAMEQISIDTLIDGQNVKLKLPFVNLNYRMYVRVVDFMPSELGDFSLPREKKTAYDILSDAGEYETSSGSEADEAEATLPEEDWEWHFYLKLEDAAAPPGEKKKTMWAMVDNPAAQCLMNLDASDLRNNPADLDILRQRLFLFWGELEERKAQQSAQKKNALAAARLGQPPQDSSDDEGHGRKDEPVDEITNRPFSCCVRQYGLKVKEDDEAKADAGEGRRWQRMYGLFGTMISAK